MSDQPGGEPKVRDLTVEDVARGLSEGRIVLVDVREPNETAVERFPGAVLVPLSSFDPATIPAPPGSEVVFACRSGRRSRRASTDSGPRCGRSSLAVLGYAHERPSDRSGFGHE